MPNYVSPGVYVIENDISDFPAQINSSVVGIVGFADRGPIAGLNNNTATLITSQQQLIDTFGEPSEAIKGQALEGALEILEATNSMRFIRCAGDSAAEASAAVTIGACPAFLVSGTGVEPLLAGVDGVPGRAANGGVSAIGSSDTNTSSVRFIVTTYDQNRTKIVDSKTYTVAKGTLPTTARGGATTIAALKKVVGGSLDADRFGAFADANTLDASSFLVGLAGGQAATTEVQMQVLNDQDVYVDVAGLSPLNGLGASGTPTANGTASGTSIDTTTATYQVKSLFPGAGYNAGTKSDGSTSGVSFEVGVLGAANTSLAVNNLGVAAETFIAGATSSSFLESEIGINYDARTSNYITANFVTGTYDDVNVGTGLLSFEKQAKDLLGEVTLTGGQGAGSTGTAVNPRFVKLVQGTYNLADGDSGIPAGDTAVATAVVGEVKATGGKTGIEALDDPLLNVSIALAPGPGVGDLQTVQNGLITVAERTTDFLAALSPPYAIGKTGDAIDWSNGFATSRSAAINSSYAAIYWPWVKVFQVFDGKDRYLDPAIFGVRQMAVTDSVAFPWFAPAGFVRGRLTKPTDVEVVLNQGDRDSLYSGGNCINPIVNFPQNGIAIFGQRTAQRQPTALDRINVRRMMIYIKKVILASTQRLVFEPNDRFTWARVEDLINPLLGDISRNRGITEFKVVCNETTNTPIRIDRNEMWCKVLIKPTKTAEMVVFELNLTSQSASIS
jgi:phage tail sheath protein FI